MLFGVFSQQSREYKLARDCPRHSPAYFVFSRPQSSRPRVVAFDLVKVAPPAYDVPPPPSRPRAVAFDLVKVAPALDVFGTESHS